MAFGIRPRLLTVLLLLAGLVGPVGPVGGQPVPEAALDDEPPLVEIPETVVPGRPQSFPAEPLSEGTLVTPDRTGTLRGASGSAVTVIEGEAIRASGQSSVLEVLRGTVGLDVVQQGGPGKITSLFLRGANSEHTKVLLDGIPLNNPADPTRRFDFSTLTVDNIERIEVVRGPQSVVYGSDAIGGVINIITKRGEGPATFRARAMGGSFGTHEERVQISGGDACRYYALSGSYLDTDGFSTVSRRFNATEADGYQNASFSGRFGWTPSDLINIDYVFRYVDADSEVDGFDPATFMPADQLNRENRFQQFFNRVQLQSFAWEGLVEQKVGFSLTDFSTLDTDPGVFGTPRFDGQARQVDWQTNLVLAEENVFTAGVDYLQEEAAPFAGGLQTQHLASLYLQDQFRLGTRSFTTIGVRWDDHSVAGSAQTYRFTQVFEIEETGGRIHGSLGRGFRAPAISQRFGAVGNPNLRPEFSKGWDVGLEQTLADGTLVLDATYFRNDFQDLIVFVAGPFGPFGFGQLRNVQQALSSGVEFTASTQLTCQTRVSVSYTYTETDDLLNNRPLLRRPRNKGAFNVQHEFLEDRAALGVYFLYVGSRADFDAFGAVVDLADYITVNLSGRYRLNETWQLFGRVDNLTDSDYEEVFAFATAGISGYAGLEFVW